MSACSAMPAKVASSWRGPRVSVTLVETALAFIITRHEVYSTVYTHRDRDQVVVGGPAAFCSHQMRLLHRYLQQYLHDTCRAGHRPRACYCTGLHPASPRRGTGVDSGDASGSSDESWKRITSYLLVLGFYLGIDHAKHRPPIDCGVIPGLGGCLPRLPVICRRSRP